MSIYEKISKIQSKLEVPKNNYNKFGKYNYRSCEDILKNVKPLLHEEGLTMTVSDELTKIGDRYYIKATVSIIDPKEGDRHEVNGYAREEENKKGMDSMQLTGATSSYARKYALNGMFSIDDTKDSDATNTHNSKQQNKSGSHISKIRKLYQANSDKLQQPIINYLGSVGYENLSDVKKLDKKQAKQLYQQIKEVV